MGAFRITDQDPVYFDALGVPCAGGSLEFYDSGTTTPKSVYGEPALSTDNGSTLTLDSSGRAAVDVWGLGVYRVILKDADGVVVWTRDDVQVSGDTFPAGTDGQFLSLASGTPTFVDLTQLPDPSGHSGDSLQVVGDAYVLQAPVDAQTGVIKQQTVVAESPTTTIDLSLGCSIILSQDVDTSLVFTNPPTTSETYFVTIARAKDATGTARAISNLGSLAYWPGGAPTLTQTSGARDELHFKFLDGVTKARGTYALDLS